ncbi:uncharacterized protein [Lolium perenne]|uniref:uncharacterized protein n=1 Tax=Lolium perenne TaxID=4522 RepID=UPI003A99557A
MQAITQIRTFTIHGGKEIEVVYTNEEETMSKYLKMYAQWYAEEEENKFVGLDLEYTPEDPNHEEDNYLAVAQLCMRNHVLVTPLFLEIVIVKGLNERGNLMRDGMASLATSIIDESYGLMKSKFPRERHKDWDEQPLSDLNLEYAAKDAYVSYQLYVKIWFFLRYLVFCPGCKKEDELRGRLCCKCRVAEIEAEQHEKCCS